MTSVLLRAIRIVIRADSDPARQALFTNLMGSHPAVRLVYQLHQRLGGGWASALLVSGYGVAAYLGIAAADNRQARVVAVAKHANARRQVARVAGWVGPSDCARLRTGRRALASASALAGVVTLVTSGRLGRVLRIIRAVDRRHGFLVACRVAGAIAWYARARALLRQHRPGAVLVSSDSNPEEVGFAAAARSLDIPQIFVSHAYPTPYSPPLDFSLSILEGEAAVAARAEKGPIRGAVVLAGIEGDSAPLDASRFGRPDPVIGIFAPKAVSWPTLAATIDDCRRHFQARRIVIRWHPSMLEPPHLALVIADRAGIVESPRDALLADVAGECDWVVADENSNVHLPVLKLGIPTIAVRSLGLYPHTRSDLYGFDAGGIVFPPVTSIREVDAGRLAAFFSAEWAARFTRYDAFYLRPPDAVAGEVRGAILRLFDEQGSTTYA